MNLWLDKIKYSCYQRKVTFRFHEMFMFKRDLKGMFMTSAQGCLKRYGHGLTKISHILFKVDRTVFKNQ